MKKLFALILFTSVISAASAQQQAGDYQVQAQFAYYSFSGLSYGTLYLNGSKFITDHIEVGISPQLTFSTETTFNLSFYGNYNFLTKDAKMVPYAGASIFLIDLGSENSDAGFGLKGGLRYFLTERVNIDAGPQVVFAGGETLFVFTAGLGFIFGRRS
ncbi:hypothetical protein BH09BAC3_BH09BAC3_11650 [soil metagenome]